MCQMCQIDVCTKLLLEKSKGTLEAKLKLVVVWNSDAVDKLLTPVTRYEEQWRAQGQLEVQKLNGMHRRNTEGRWLLIFVMHLMEILIQPPRVIHAMENISHVVLRKKMINCKQRLTIHTKRSIGQKKPSIMLCKQVENVI